MGGIEERLPRIFPTLSSRIEGYFSPLAKGFRLSREPVSDKKSILPKVGDFFLFAFVCKNPVLLLRNSLELRGLLADSFRKPPLGMDCLGMASLSSCVR